VLPEIQRPDKHEKSQTDGENSENDDAPPLKHGTINALFLPPGKSDFLDAKIGCSRQKAYCKGRPLLSNFTTVTTM